MITKELNRDIKRLWKKRESFIDGDSEDYWEWIKGDFIPEFTRLYYADSKCEYMNLSSFRIMYRLNQCHRVIPFAFAWINLEIK